VISQNAAWANCEAAGGCEFNLSFVRVTDTAGADRKTTSVASSLG
jgi:hypothetical protein